MNYGVVYVATNTVTGKQYVGQTIDRPMRRWNNHFARAKKGGDHPLYCSIRKHGRAAFDFAIVCTAEDQDSLNKFERAFIQSLNTIVPNGYNLRDGGDGGGKHSEDTKARWTAFRNLPEQKALQSERQKIVQNLPDVAARRDKGLREAWQRPGAKERRGKINSDAQSRPEVVAKKRAIALIVQNRPDVRAKKAEAYERPEVRAKMGQTRDTIWINDGLQNRRIREDAPIPDGWALGRTYFENPKSGNGVRGTRWITDGQQNRRISAECELPNGWRHGRAGKRVEF